MQVRDCPGAGDVLGRLMAGTEVAIDKACPVPKKNNRKLVMGDV